MALAAAQGGENRAFDFNALLDSLHVPRVRPNGRAAAHIGWKYRPGDGSRLAD